MLIPNLTLKLRRNGLHVQLGKKRKYLFTFQKYFLKNIKTVKKISTTTRRHFKGIILTYVTALVKTPIKRVP